MHSSEKISYGEKVKIDEKDKKILELLHRNARMQVSEISRKTGIQRDSVVYRIKKLEKQKVIRTFTTVLNPSKLGFPIYGYVSFELQNFDEKSEKEFISFLVANPQITYVSKLTGKWDFEIVIAAKDFEDFDKIIRNVRLRFSNIIKEYVSSMIIQEYKYDYLVDLIGLK